MKIIDLIYTCDGFVNSVYFLKSFELFLYEKCRVKWLGYPESESTWEPIENLTNCIDVVIKFNESQTEKGKLFFELKLSLT